MFLDDQLLGEAKQRVDPAVLEYTQVTEENIFRELAKEIVSKIRIHKPGKFIMEFKKTDPFSEESVKALKDNTLSNSEREEILSLQKSGLILFKVEYTNIREH